MVDRRPPFGLQSAAPGGGMAMMYRAALLAGCIGLCSAVNTQTERPTLQVRTTADFEVTGAGDNDAWRRTEWTALRRREPDGHPYDSRFKMLYSTTGLYFLMEGTDRKLTATMSQDFEDLWKEDVVEVFLWTD